MTTLSVKLGRELIIYDQCNYLDLRFPEFFGKVSEWQSHLAVLHKTICKTSAGFWYRRTLSFKECLIGELELEIGTCIRNKKCGEHNNSIQKLRKPKQLHLTPMTQHLDHQKLFRQYCSVFWEKKRKRKNSEERTDNQIENTRTKRMSASRLTLSFLGHLGYYNLQRRPPPSGLTFQDHMNRLFQRKCCKIFLGHRNRLYASHQRYHLAEMHSIPRYLKKSRIVCTLDCNIDRFRCVTSIVLGQFSSSKWIILRRRQICSCRLHNGFWLRCGFWRRRTGMEVPKEEECGYGYHESPDHIRTRQHTAFGKCRVHVRFRYFFIWIQEPVVKKSSAT